MLDFVIFDDYNCCCNNNSITEGAKNMRSNLAEALNDGGIPWLKLYLQITTKVG